MARGRGTNIIVSHSVKLALPSLRRRGSSNDPYTRFTECRPFPPHAEAAVRGRHTRPRRERFQRAIDVFARNRPQKTSESHIRPHLLMSQRS